MDSNTPSVFQKVPPHDAEAEAAVLSSMFIDKEAASAAVELVKAEDF